jgi:hypothetical protein
MVKFTIPAKVKPLNSEATKKVYKTYLNRIAAFDLDSVEKVVENPEDVIKIIDVLVSVEDDVEKKKQEARIYYSALFFVLYEHPFLSDPENILRISFQRFRPKTTTGGEKWLPVQEFKNKSLKE